MYTHKSFPPFNDHGASCKGHSNHMLDSTMENEEDREAFIRVLDKYINEYEGETKNIS